VFFVQVIVCITMLLACSASFRRVIASIAGGKRIMYAAVPLDFRPEN
jgi:hypothetical protein